jgi:hypothetical protein
VDLSLDDFRFKSSFLESCVLLGVIEGCTDPVHRSLALSFVENGHSVYKGQGQLCPLSRRSLSDFALISCATAANGSLEPILPDAAETTNGSESQEADI